MRRASQAAAITPSSGPSENGYVLQPWRPRCASVPVRIAAKGSMELAMPVTISRPGSSSYRPLGAPHGHHQQNHDEQQPEAARRIVAPAGAIGPSRQGADEQQNQ